MAEANIPSNDSLFRRTLAECRDLYVSSAALCAQEYPHLLPQGKAKRTLSAEEFIALMDDLHRTDSRYGFDRHKGYATAAHLAAVAKHGYSEAHRRSFRPATLFDTLD